LQKQPLSKAPVAPASILMHIQWCTSREHMPGKIYFLARWETSSQQVCGGHALASLLRCCSPFPARAPSRRRDLPAPVPLSGLSRDGGLALSFTLWPLQVLNNVSSTFSPVLFPPTHETRPQTWSRSMRTRRRCDFEGINTLALLHPSSIWWNQSCQWKCLVTRFAPAARISTMNKSSTSMIRRCYRLNSIMYK